VEEDYIIAKLAQEDVETLYNLLNKVYQITGVSKNVFGFGFNKFS
jgi:hypothetical protein